jgi:hypothetical protein
MHTTQADILFRPARGEAPVNRFDARVYSVPMSLSTITRGSGGTFVRARGQVKGVPYPDPKSIVKRAEKNVGRRGKDCFDDLWMVDLLHAHAITASGILNKQDAQGPLGAFLRRGLYDREDPEGVIDASSQRSMRYTAASGAMILEHLVDLYDKVHVPRRPV